MPLSAIVYASQAVAGLDSERLALVVEMAAAANAELAVTGVLLHDGQRFLQYIEGPDPALRQVYRRICAATSHHEMMELCRGRIDARRFPGWAMRLVPSSPPALRELVLSDWSALVRTRQGVAGAGTAIDRLIGLINSDGASAPLEHAG